MDVISRYVREQNRYSKNELKKIFNLDNESFEQFSKKLKAYGILKMVKSTYNQKDLNELNKDDIEIVYEDKSNVYYYVFTFVGVLVIDNIVIKSFPKYIVSKKEPLEEMKQVIKVLRKYKSMEQNLNLSNGYEEEKQFNLLSTILYFISDYNEYGLYTKQQKIIETNGEGEIFWDSTINDTFAIIIKNRPIYTELQTINMVDDDSDYFTRLHKFIITDGCRKLKNLGLLELMDLDEINISDDEFEYFGEKNYILKKIEKELSIQFINRNQILLKTLYMYIAENKLFEDGIGLSMYGTNSFNLVWEKVCAYVFNDKRLIPIGKLNLPLELHDDYLSREEETLLQIIEKPIWRYFDTDGEKYDNEADTLIPDLVSIYSLEDGMCFSIFDAKYYVIEIGKDKLKGQPGIGDITKQYLYQLAYNDFIVKHGFKYVKNAFLIPSEKDEIISNAEVEMKILNGLSTPPLTNISVVELPAKKIYDYYLRNKKIDIRENFTFL